MHRLRFVALAVAVVSAGCITTVQDLTGQVNNDWVLQQVQADAVHARGYTGEGIWIAVIDTGISADHPEFAGLSGRLKWLDLVNGRSAPYDDHGHGTHVAGVVAAQGNAGALGPRVTGVAPGAGLIVVKALGGNGEGTTRTVARAIDESVKAGADVILLSLGGQPGFLLFGTEAENAVRDAVAQGVVVVAAGGNRGEDQSGCTVTSPASIPEVIAVSAVDRDGQLASFACRGDNSGLGPLGLGAPQDPHKKPELLAPGVRVPGPWNGGACGSGPPSDYCFLDGTSQAAPVVAAVAALLLQARGGLDGGADVEALKRALTATATPAGDGSPSDHSDTYGYGIVDANAALSRWVTRR